MIFFFFFLRVRAPSLKRYVLYTAAKKRDIFGTEVIEFRPHLQRNRYVHDVDEP